MGTVGCLIFLLIFSPPSISSISDKSLDFTHHLQKLKLKIAQLESTTEEIIETANAKGLFLKEKERQINEMTHKIHFLQTTLADMKKSLGGSIDSEERIHRLEEEVRSLWAASRKNNFDMHNLGSKVQEAEEKVEELTSRVEQMENIVMEQWIQIRQLEQGLQMTKMQTMQAQAMARSTKCIFLKFIDDFNKYHLQKFLAVLETNMFETDSVFNPYLSQASHKFQRIFSAARKYHHELQGSVKQLMDKNEYTAALANKEVVFFLASALITFPLMGAWIAISSCFC